MFGDVCGAKCLAPRVERKIAGEPGGGVVVGASTTARRTVSARERPLRRQIAAARLIAVTRRSSTLVRCGRSYRNSPGVDGRSFQHWGASSVAAHLATRRFFLAGQVLQSAPTQCPPASSRAQAVVHRRVLRSNALDSSAGSAALSLARRRHSSSHGPSWRPRQYVESAPCLIARSLTEHLWR